MRRMLIAAGLAAGLVGGVGSGLRGASYDDGIVLRVLDAETGEPVGGADVRFLDLDADGPRPVHGDRRLHGESTVRAHDSVPLEALGSTHRTDEKGELRLPPFAKIAYVSASHAGLYDFAVLRTSRPEESVLKLVPDAMVRVQVLDSKGKPVAGVPVLIRRYPKAAPADQDQGGIVIRGGGGGGGTVQTIDSGGSSSSRPWTLAGADTKGAEGLAELRHVQAIIGERKEGQRTVVAIATLLPEPVEVELPADGWSEEPLVLKLPETGELEVLVVDSAGKSLHDPLASITLGQLPERKGEPKPGMPDFRSAFNRDRVIWTPEGRALFPFVGLGLEFEASLNREWLSGPLDVKGFGPTEAGERATLTVQCPVPDSRLSGRVLDEEGKPVISKELGFWREFVVGGSGGMGTSTGYVMYHTDETGRFDVLVGPGAVGPGPAGDWDTLKFSIRDRDRATGADRLASFEFDMPLEPGPKDLGDVVLVAPPLLVSGIVVDEEGKPVPGASFHVEVKKFFGQQPRDPEKERRFMWIGSQAQSRSGLDGRFEVRWELEQDELRLVHFNRATGEDDTMIVSRGDTDVRFVVKKDE
jgi:hypothetical protein